jgi:hypothetical protein
LLHESKLELISNSVVQSLWGSQRRDWCHSSSRGSSILVLWDRRVVQRIEECVGEYTPACSFRNVEDGFSWAFVAVYGPTSDCDRRYL